MQTPHGARVCGLGEVTVTHPTLSCPHPGTGLGDTLLHVPPPHGGSRWPWGSCVSSPVSRQGSGEDQTDKVAPLLSQDEGGRAAQGWAGTGPATLITHAGPGQHWTPAGTCVSTTRGPAYSHVRGDTHLPWVSMRRGQATRRRATSPTQHDTCERGHPKSQTGTSAPRCWVTCPGPQRHDLMDRKPPPA